MWSRTAQRVCSCTAAAWDRSGPLTARDAQRTSARFVARINAYIDYITRKPELLPFEFRQLGYMSSRWRLEDVVRIRSHGLTRNLTQEVARVGSAARGPVRAQMSPAWTARIPEGLDPCLPDNAREVFTRATENVRFERHKLQVSRALPNEETLEGSNNWVVAPLRPPDPGKRPSPRLWRALAALHRAPERAWSRRDRPREPALPGVSIGHHGKVAFGLTIFSIDQEDPYVYEINQKNPRQYRYPGGWENFRVMRETVTVRGGQARRAELRFTRHGPVIHQDASRRRALAVRTAWTAPGTAPYFGSISYMKAQDFTQFRRAMERRGAPTEKQVYADTAGNIGWVAGAWRRCVRTGMA